MTQEHPAPWWYRLAARIVPSRCREIPEARNPDRILLRQVAIIKRTAYMQQFASGEDDCYMHEHEFRRCICVGLWGGYTEKRWWGTKVVRAPYLYTMLPDVVHQVTRPTPGHTSLFIGIGRFRERRYYHAHSPAKSWPWTEHVKKQVKRV